MAAEDLGLSEQLRRDISARVTVRIRRKGGDWIEYQQAGNKAGVKKALSRLLGPEIFGAERRWEVVEGKPYKSKPRGPGYKNSRGV